MPLASKARVIRTLPRLAAMVAATVMVAVCTSAAPAAVTTVMDAATNNGSFTSPDVVGFAVGAPTGWTAGGNTGNQGVQDGGVDANQLVFWNAPSGSNGADILYRNNLYTVAAAGEMIDMSWYIGGNSGAGDGWILGELRLDGVAADSSGYVYANTVSLGGTGSLQALSYTTLAGDIGKQIGVYFNFTSNSGAVQLLLDQVEVTVTTIPAPAALPAGLAMLGLAAGRRRRR